METIKKIRAYLGMTQRAFSDYIGVSLRTIEEWEKGRRNPKEYIIELIILKVKTDLATSEQQKFEDFLQNA